MLTWGVVRGCPLGTGSYCYEWHAGGTAGEGDPGTAWRRWLDRDRRVRPVLGDHRLVGKSLEGVAAAGSGDANSTEASLFSVPKHSLTQRAAVVPAADGHLFIRGLDMILERRLFVLSGETLRVDGQISLPDLINTFSWIKDLDSLIRGNAHQENGI